MMKADAELIECVRRGDTSAFDTLVERHYAACLRLASWQLGHRDPAEDVVQESLIRAYRALRRGHTPREFRAWLLGIVVNRCRSHAARSRRRRLLFQRWWASQEPEAYQAASLEDAGSDNDVDPKLRAALAALSPRLREAFLLKHLECLRYEEMSRITGTSVSALKMRVKRATDQLRSMLMEDRE